VAQALYTARRRPARWTAAAVSDPVWQQWPAHPPDPFRDRIRRTPLIGHPLAPNALHRPGLMFNDASPDLLAPYDDPPRMDCIAPANYAGFATHSTKFGRMYCRSGECVAGRAGFLHAGGNSLKPAAPTRG
jgi:hypothetical protein